jgi:cytochrome c oxidase cbb3-type subunit 2
MNNGPLLFLGIFLTVAFSWTGIVLTNLVQQRNSGADRPFYDTQEEAVAPAPVSGEARQGARVYQQLGCLYCHSQQVRHPLRGRANTEAPDVARGWGDRPNVARDYVSDERVMLGSMRTGPDLRNVGSRTEANWHLRHLYNPLTTSPGSIMPPYPFLFEVRKITGAPSGKALSALGEYAPPEGYEVVPTPRAEALVAYLMSLRTSPVPLPETSGGAR